MKFIILIEENGYQVRYWDEINNDIGECIAESWDNKNLLQILKSKGFNIKKQELEEAIKAIEEEPFVILSSQNKDPQDLDTFINSLFKIEK
jgi:hypothetical protein